MYLPQNFKIKRRNQNIQLLVLSIGMSMQDLQCKTYNRPVHCISIWQNIQLQQLANEQCLTVKGPKMSNLFTSFIFYQKLYFPHNFTKQNQPLFYWALQVSVCVCVHAPTVCFFSVLFGADTPCCSSTCDVPEKLKNIVIWIELRAGINMQELQ